jgi:hypothetical protein
LATSGGPRLGAVACPRSGLGGLSAYQALGCGAEGVRGGGGGGGGGRGQRGTTCVRCAASVRGGALCAAIKSGTGLNSNRAPTNPRLPPPFPLQNRRPAPPRSRSKRSGEGGITGRPPIPNRDGGRRGNCARTRLGATGTSGTLHEEPSSESHEDSLGSDRDRPPPGPGPPLGAWLAAIKTPRQRHRRHRRRRRGFDAATHSLRLRPRPPQAHGRWHARGPGPGRPRLQIRPRPPARRRRHRLPRLFQGCANPCEGPPRPEPSSHAETLGSPHSTRSPAADSNPSLPNQPLAASAACDDASKLCGAGGCGALLVTKKYAKAAGGKNTTCCVGLGERGGRWGAPDTCLPPGRLATGKGLPVYGPDGHK